MKKFLRGILILTLVTMLGLETIAPVYAAGESDPKRWGRATGSLGSNVGAGSGVANGGKKCKPTDLCFTGTGLFIYLVKYDAATKTETLVGRPQLYHTSSFLKEQKVVNTEDISEIPYANESSETIEKFAKLLGALSGSSAGSSVIEFLNGLLNLIGLGMKKEDKCYYKPESYYEFEEILIYPKNKIKYYVMGQQIDKSRIDFHETSQVEKGKFVNYILNTLLPNIFGGGVSGVNSYFNTNIKYDEADKYYVAFEFAKRSGNETPQGSFTIKRDSAKYKVDLGTDSRQYIYKCSSKPKITETKLPGESKPEKGSNGCTKRHDRWYINGTTTRCNTKNHTGCYNDPYDTDEPYNYDSCTGIKVTLTKHLTTKTYPYEESKVKTARSAGSSTLLKWLCTPKGSVCGESATYGDNCTGNVLPSKVPGAPNIIEHYIGPAIDTALVGSTSKGSKYNLSDNSCNGSASNTAVGVSYWWLPTGIDNFSYNCIQECGENNLKCAENYCENHTVFNKNADNYLVKNQCLRESCKVKEKKYGCEDFMSENNIQLTCNGTISSECNKKPVDFSVLDDNFDNQTSVWCYSDPDTMPYDQKTFTNIVCQEKNVYEFTDITKQKLSPGVGIDYSAKLNASKKCLIWFDVDDWTMTYASIKERDESCLGDREGTCTSAAKNTRELLKKAIESYNRASLKETEDSFKEEDGIGYSIEAVLTSLAGGKFEDAEIIWANTIYDMSEERTKVTTTIKETLNNKAVDGMSGTFELERKEEPELTTTFSTTTKTSRNTATTYERLKTGTVTVKSHNVLNNTAIDFEFPMYCALDDGKGTVLKSESCSANEDGLGRRKFYTSANIQLKSTDDYKVEVTNTTGTVGIGNIPATTKQALCNLGQSEMCEREGHLTCELEVDSDDLEVIDGLYSADEIKVKIRRYASLEEGDSIQGYTLQVSDKPMDLAATTERKEETTINLKNYNKITSIWINGVVSTSKGKVVRCYKEIKVSNRCTNNGCSISKVGKDGNKDLFKINGASGTYEVTSTNGNYTTRFNVSQSNRKTQTGHFFDLDIANKNEGLVIQARQGNTCCEYKEAAPGTTNCEKWNKNYTKKESEVREYCAENWSTDIKRYRSAEHCVQSCTISCGDIFDDCSQGTMQREEAKALCSKYYSGNETRINQCINKCYCNYCGCGNEIYRPISNVDPFPDKTSGERLVGGNWMGYEEYITNDKYDKTAITGPGANQAVEYIIELDKSKIMELRNDNASDYNQYIELDGTGKEYKSIYIRSLDILKQSIRINGKEVIALEYGG